MSNVNAEIKMQGNNDAWFTTNAAVVYPANVVIYHTDGRYKYTDGVTALSALTFRGAGGSATWGGITGTLSNQTDLQTVLNNKEPLKGSDDNYVTDAQLVVIGNTSGTNSGDNATNSTSNTYADGKVADSITNGVTTIAPSQNAVFDALALKSAGTIIITSGTSFTTPSDITASTIFFIELVGAGGGGAGTHTSNCTPGGGGGGYCFVKITGLSPSTTYTCAIGQGGAGGAAGGSNNGNNGGNTTIVIGAVTYSANGGAGAVAQVSTNGGAGGTATNGDVNISGQAGGDAPASNPAVIAGEGGDSPMGYGNGGKETRASKTGNSGSGYGAGGSGGKTAGGGNGTNGIIVCKYVN